MRGGQCDRPRKKRLGMQLKWCRGRVEANRGHGQSLRSRVREGRHMELNEKSKEEKWCPVGRL